MSWKDIIVKRIDIFKPREVYLQKIIHLLDNAIEAEGLNFPMPSSYDGPEARDEEYLKELGEIKKKVLELIESLKDKPQRPKRPSFGGTQA